MPIIRSLQRVFLPENYPYSVSPFYPVYVRWKMLHWFFSVLCDVISFKFLLLSTLHMKNAVFRWLLRDGCAHVACIVYSCISAKYYAKNSQYYMLLSVFMLSASHLLYVVSFVDVPNQVILTTVAAVSKFLYLKALRRN